MRDKVLCLGPMPTLPSRGRRPAIRAADLGSGNAKAPGGNYFSSEELIFLAQRRGPEPSEERRALGFSSLRALGSSSEEKTQHL